MELSTNDWSLSDSRGSLVYIRNNASFPSSKGFSSFDDSDKIDFSTGEILNSTTDYRKDRYILKSVVNGFIPNSRTAKCMRLVRGDHTKIFKYTNPKSKKVSAFYGNLMVCGSVWLCPLCAAKISEKRRIELKKGFDVAKSKDLDIVMLTLTAPHYKGDNLKDLTGRMQKSLTKSLKDSGGKSFIAKYGLVGRVRALEVTWSENNGFHPHFHILLFMNKSVNESLMAEMKVAFYKEWKNACVHYKLGEPSFEHGVSVDGAREAEGYITKWGLDYEMTKGHIKKSKKGFSMFDLLRKYDETGDEKYKKIWMIYAKAFKGKRQLVWSNGLRELLGMDEELKDEELASAHEEKATLFKEIKLLDWVVVYKAKAEHYLLKLVEKNATSEEVDLFILGLKQYAAFIDKQRELPS